MESNPLQSMLNKARAAKKREPVHFLTLKSDKAMVELAIKGFEDEKRKEMEADAEAAAAEAEAEAAKQVAGIEDPDSPPAPAAPVKAEKIVLLPVEGDVIEEYDTMLQVLERKAQLDMLGVKCEIAVQGGDHGEVGKAK